LQSLKSLIPQNAAESRHVRTTGLIIVIIILIIINQVTEWM